MKRPTLRTATLTLIRHEMRLRWRQRTDVLQSALAFVLSVILAALSFGGDEQHLAEAAPAIVWLCALIAAAFSTSALFRADCEDGSLEQWMLSPLPLAWLVLVRIVVEWATTQVLLLICTLLLIPLLHLPRPLVGPLMLSLALGTPLLCLLGALVAALTVALKRSGAIPVLLSLPLYVPVLVFGVSSVTAANHGLDGSGALFLLAAGLSIAIVVAPWATAVALRIALS